MGSYGKFVVFGQASLLAVALLIVRPGIAASGGPEVTFSGVSLSVESPTVPPGGLLQMQVFMTEPKPILKGKQGVKASRAAAVAASASVLGPMRDAALFSTGSDVSGVAVTGAAGTEFFFSSPLSSFGMLEDTPVITIAYPVSPTANDGQSASLQLDPNNSLWLDPGGNQYPVELKSGTMTVGGSLSISDVVPGAGTVPAGTVFSIKGVGFQPATKIDFGEGKVVTQEFVSSNQINVTLRGAFRPRGQRIRLENPGNERVTYFPYQRTSRIGNSTHALLAASYPLFPQTSLTLGYFRSTLHGTMFSGLALQNLNSTQVTATLQLFSKAGVLLSEHTVAMGKNTRFVRDLAELFPGVVPADGTKLTVTSTRGIQMLGLLGDDATGIVLPIRASKTP